MIQFIKTLSLLILLCFQVVASESLRDLNSISGKIFNVDQENRMFDILLPTEYDPKTNEGKSRYRVYWNEKTSFKKIIIHNNFKVLEQKVLASISLNENNSKALQNHQALKVRNITLYPTLTKATGLRKDGKALSAWMKPNPKDKNLRSALVEFDSKDIKVSLDSKKAKVYSTTFHKEDIISSGFFNAKINGKYVEDKFMLSSVSLFPLVDPRTVDDPKLPRVLVIGDSISMNYHEAAKSALVGKANYYRVEGNAGPSDRGVSNVSLWLGDYQTKGLHWDVIQFNHGLHDLKQVYDESTKTYGPHQVSLDDYTKNLHKIIQVLQQTGAKLMYCTTTPVPNNSYGQFGRRKDEDLVFNKAALEVVRQYSELHINDLNKTVRDSKVFDKWREGSNVHFYNEEQTALGEAVAQAVLNRLSE